MSKVNNRAHGFFMNSGMKLDVEVFRAASELISEWTSFHRLGILQIANYRSWGLNAQYIFSHTVCRLAI